MNDVVFKTWNSVRLDFIKPFYYRFASVPEDYLEWVHEKVEDAIEAHIEYEKTDGHGEYFNMFREHYKDMHGKDLAIEFPDEVELLYNDGYGIHQDAIKANYIDGCVFEEFEISLESCCQEWIQMHQIEHDAYDKWCDVHGHEQPSEGGGLVYVSHVGSITLQWVHDADLVNCAKCNRKRRAWSGMDGDKVDIHIGRICHECWVCKDCGCDCNC